MIGCVAARSRWRLVCAAEGARDVAIGGDVGIARCNERSAGSHSFAQRKARKVDRLARDRARDCDRWGTGHMGYELHLSRRTSLSNSREEAELPRRGR